MRLTKKAIEEQTDFKLLSNSNYQQSFGRYTEELYNRERRYGRYTLGTPEKNMLRALRLMKSMNTPDEWARLHAYEAWSKRSRISR